MLVCMSTTAMHLREFLCKKKGVILDLKNLKSFFRITHFVNVDNTIGNRSNKLILTLKTNCLAQELTFVTEVE